MLKTGILKTRHNVVNETVELLVFGYQSKLYRDDAKAQEFDRESHLIPAPYDNNLTISRYDVRATLDAAPQENDNMYLNRLECLSQAEQQAEAMAEKERYYSLYINEVEEEMKQEELLKRQTAEYNQIPFNYDEIGPKESASVAEEPEEIDTTPFESPLELPPDMESPDTLKQHQIIEKTAKFIASQGPQMEILLKTKQSSNSQFNFLSHDGQYNAYYKHILMLIKAGTYEYFESGDSKKDEEVKQEENGHAEDPEPTTPAIIIPKLAFVPSADCAYTQLISKITKAPISAIEQQRKFQVENSANGNSGIKSLGLLASYCSDSDDDSEDNGEENSMFVGSLPSTEIQVVIDKTAMYVAKNGREFEETLKKKDDSRFQFLNPDDELHAYYIFKVNESKKSLPSSIPTSIAVRATRVEIKKPGENAVVETAKMKNPPAPVSFSIKPKEDKSQLIPKSFDETAENSNKSQSPKKISVEEELEMQVDVMKAEREDRLAKEKLKGKIFTAARRNLIPKEKILQIERKKKALMFVNQIKGSNSNGAGNGNSNNEVINLTTCNDDSDDSVKSIPISSSSKRKHSSRSRSRKRSTRSSSSSRSRSSRSRSSYSSDTSRSRRKHKKSKSHRRKRSKHRRKSSRSRSRSRSYSSRRKRGDRRDRRH